MYSTTWIAAAVRSVLYASALSAGVLRVICACRRSRSAKVHQPTSPPGSGRLQQQQQRASLLAQLKAQEEAIAAAAANCAKPDSLNQLNKQIDEMNAALAKLERQRASQERNLAAQLDAAFRRGRIPASRWCSAVKRASAISGCRSISAISTSPPRLSRS